MLKRYADDYELVQECRTGNEEAYGILVARLKGTITANVLNRVPPRDAPDVIQDIFIV